MEKTTAEGALRLDFASTMQVVVTPENQDRFMMTSKAAARACQQAADDQRWHDQFRAFIAFLHEWCEQHAEDVRQCYLTVGDNGMNALILLKSEHYNFDLDDALAQLDLKLFQDFPLVRSDVIQIPNQRPVIEELTSETAEAMIVYGDGAGSSGPSDS